jgi:uncharacterized ion transporter superfamily protein YfcC
METASIPGFVRTIFWIIAIYYIIKILARLFLPVIAKKVVEKASQQFQQQQENYQNQNTTQNQTNQKPKEKKIVGDYVDFEEIE